MHGTRLACRPSKRWKPQPALLDTHSALSSLRPRHKTRPLPEVLGPNGWPPDCQVSNCHKALQTPRARQRAAQRGLDGGRPAVGLLNAAPVRAALTGIAHRARRQPHRRQLGHEVVLHRLGDAREDGLKVVLRAGTARLNADSKEAPSLVPQSACKICHRLRPPAKARG